MFKRVWITGDTHGDFSWLQEWCKVNKTTTEEDMLIILGDAGILYFGQEHPHEITKKNIIASCPVTLFCVRGNHEDRPEDRVECILQDVGIVGKVFVDDQYPNIWYAQDGGEYEIAGMWFLTIGGAYSVDKPLRLMRNWKWVPNEMLSDKEMAAIKKKVKGHIYDHVLTHTCPYDWQPVDLFIRGIDEEEIPHNMEWFLSDIRDEIYFVHWWFGHFHADRYDVCGDGKVTMLYGTKLRVM